MLVIFLIRKIYLKNNPPSLQSFIKTGLTPFVTAMPDIYKRKCPIESYRLYYMSPEKQKIATWKKRRSQPEWYLFEDEVFIYF